MVIRLNDKTCAWDVIKANFDEHGMVRQQIDSFDDLMMHIIPSLVRETPEITVTKDTSTYSFKLENAFATKPEILEHDNVTTFLTPQMCRQRNLSYQSNIYCDLKHTTIVDGKKTVKYQKILLTKIPVMLQSEYCMLKGKTKEELLQLFECDADPGGYFILKGAEKVLIAQERMATNQVYIFESKLGFSFAEIRSVSDGTSKSSGQTIMKFIQNNKRGSNHETVLRVSFPNTKKDIPFVILLYALGMTDEQQIRKFCGKFSNHLDNTFQESWHIDSQESAIQYLIEKSGVPSATREIIEKMLMNDILPHEPIINDKALFLCYIADKLLRTVYGERPHDDRDHFGNKRLDLAGNLIGMLFKNSLNRVMNEFKKELEKKIASQKTSFTVNDISSGVIAKEINSALSTGNWGVTKNKVARTGVSQPLQRLTYLATVNHLKKLVAPIAKEGKQTKPRQLHNSSFGMACSNDTPEGQACGLMKSFSLLTHVSLPVRSNIKALIMDCIGEYIKEKDEYSTKIFINGTWMGNTEDWGSVVTIIKKMRMEKYIPFDVSIVNSLLDKEIKVISDAGRCCRPLFVVKDNQLLISEDDIKEMKRQSHGWSWLVEKGFVEYLDALEEEDCLIAFTEEDLLDFTMNYSHCEIHPSVILGISASLIGYANHNPSPRISYQCAQAKQAMGIYASNYQYRNDGGTTHLLCYPQTPLVKTKQHVMLGFNDMPAGENAIVAIACYTGYNQEDSIIVNRAALERGLFRSIAFKNYKEEEVKKIGTVTEEFLKPQKGFVMGYKNKGYPLIDEEDGIAYVGAPVKGGDVIMGKVTNMPAVVDEKTGNNIVQKDISVTIKPTEKGRIDQIMMTVNDEGKKMIKARVCSVRQPEIGDKLCSKNAQKGIIGMIMDQEDLPFTREGIVPDLIINTHE